MRESRTYGSVRGALSNERPYRVAVRLGLAQQLRQEPRLRRNMLDQTRQPWRAPRGTRWGASVLS